MKFSELTIAGLLVLIFGIAGTLALSFLNMSRIDRLEKQIIGLPEDEYKHYAFSLIDNTSIELTTKQLYKEMYGLWDTFHSFKENIETYLEIEWHTPQEVDQPEAHYVKKERMIPYGDRTITPTNYWNRQLTPKELEYVPGLLKIE